MVGGGALLERQHVSAAQGLSERDQILRRSDNTFPEIMRVAAHGAVLQLFTQQPLARGLAELSAGPICRGRQALRRADRQLRRRKGSTGGSLLARASLRKRRSSANQGSRLLSRRGSRLSPLLLRRTGAGAVDAAWSDHAGKLFRS